MQTGKACKTPLRVHWDVLRAQGPAWSFPGLAWALWEQGSQVSPWRTPRRGKARGTTPGRTTQGASPFLGLKPRAPGAEGRPRPSSGLHRHVGQVRNPPVPRPGSTKPVATAESTPTRSWGPWPSPGLRRARQGRGHVHACFSSGQPPCLPPLVRLHGPQPPCPQDPPQSETESHVPGHSPPREPAWPAGL